MAYALNDRHVSEAFAGAVLADGKYQVRCQVHELGRLVVTSGSIAASDPLVDPTPRPFQQRIPNGSHSVAVAVACYEGGDERVAFARVRLTETSPITWRMATTFGQDTATLRADEYFGYGVDAGTGCFMDPRAGELLSARMDEESEFYNVIIEGMDRTYRHTWSWFDFTPAEGRPENIICFSSGFGDGSYPSFFGFDSQGAVCALVTDFCLFYEPPALVSSPRWWKFWR